MMSRSKPEPCRTAGEWAAEGWAESGVSAAEWLASGNRIESPHISQELADATQLVWLDCVNCGGDGSRCLGPTYDICEDCTTCEGKGKVLGWDRPFHEVVDAMRASRDSRDMCLDIKEDKPCRR